jgi:hypothetical protein
VAVTPEREAAELLGRVRSLGRPLSEDERRTVGAKARLLREQIAGSYQRDLVERRSEVLTHGRPAAAFAARRGQDEARRRIAEKVQGSGARCVGCPAADAQRVDDGLLVHCRVEGSVLSSRTDPQSVLSFCAGDYRLCPSWRAEREAERAGRGSLVEA